MILTSDLPALHPVSPASEAEQADLHRRLTRFNRWRLSPEVGEVDWEARLTEEFPLRRCEGRFVEAERRQITELAAQAPTEADRFVAWFESLQEWGPGQGDALVCRQLGWPVSDN